MKFSKLALVAAAIAVLVAVAFVAHFLAGVLSLGFTNWHFGRP